MHSTSLLKYLKRTSRFRPGEIHTRFHSPFCIFMRRAYHLREVDDNRFAVAPPDEDVKFIEIPVNESCLCKPDNQVQQLRVEFTRRRNVVDLMPVIVRENDINRV